MKKVYLCLTVTLILLLCSACGKMPTGNTDINISRFWEEETTDEENTLKFITGLEIILPDSWNGKTVYDVETGPKNAPTSTTFIVSEKTNAEADGSGVLCYLTFYLHEEGEEQYIFETDRVLGLYEQGGKQYVLVLELPREMMYMEGNAELQTNYEALSACTDLIQIKTDEMSGFTECSADDLEWIEFTQRYIDIMLCVVYNIK